MKNALFVFTCCTVLFLSSCASEAVMVSSYSSLTNAAEEVRMTMKERGFELIQKESEDGNLKRDKYTFQKNNGDIFEYTVEYNLRDKEDLKYVKDVRLCGCKVSNGSDYVELCGSNSQVQKLEDLPKDITVKEFSPKQLVGGLICTTLIIGSLLTILLAASGL